LSRLAENAGASRLARPGGRAPEAGPRRRRPGRGRGPQAGGIGMTPCLGRGKLERLLVAPYGEGAGQELVRHGERCAACQQALESMTGAADWGSDLVGWPALAPRPAPQPDSFLRWLQQAPPWGIDRVARRRDPVRADERGRSIEPGLAPGPSETAVS